MIEVIRAFIAAVCILAGTAVMLVAAIGVNRFHYVLNRMHAAARLLLRRKKGRHHCAYEW